jgi:hypothetical protein
MTTPMSNTQVTGSAIAGGVAAVLAKILFYPLGTVRDTLTTSGVKGMRRLKFSDLYVGLPVGCFDSAQYHGMHFFLFEFFKVRMERFLQQHPLEAFPALLTGMFGGVIVNVIGAPIETILMHLRCKAGLGIADGQTTIGAIQEVVERDGFLGLWTGFRGNLLMVLQPAIIFVIVDIMKRRLTRNGKIPMKPVGSLLCGIVGEAISTCIVWPIQAANKHIKTRHLREKDTTKDERTVKDGSNKEVLEIVPVLKRMYFGKNGEGGLARIYSGVVPEVVANSLKGGFRYLVKDGMNELFIGLLEKMLHLYEVPYEGSTREQGRQTAEINVL